MDAIKLIHEEKEDLLKQLEKTFPNQVAELRAYDKLLLKLQITTNKDIIEADHGKTTETISMFDTGDQKPTKPLSAIKKLFNENPDKKYTASEITTKLKEIQNADLLIVRSKNINSTAHTVLRMLIRKEYIEKELSTAEGVNLYFKK